MPSPSCPRDAGLRRDVLEGPVAAVPVEPVAVAARRRRGPRGRRRRSRGPRRPAACARPGSGRSCAALGRNARWARARARPSRRRSSKSGSGAEAESQLEERGRLHLPAAVRRAGREDRPDLAALLAELAAAVPSRSGAGRARSRASRPRPPEVEEDALGAAERREAARGSPRDAGRELVARSSPAGGSRRGRPPARDTPRSRAAAATEPARARRPGAGRSSGSPARRELGVAARPPSSPPGTAPRRPRRRRSSPRGSGGEPRGGRRTRARREQTRGRESAEARDAARSSSRENIMRGPCLSFRSALRERIRARRADLVRRLHGGRALRPARRATTRGARAIGEGGDFVTSPHVSPAFAAALARRSSRSTPRGSKAPVDFVEVGAGEGRFLEDFAAALARERSGVRTRARG